VDRNPDDDPIEDPWRWWWLWLPMVLGCGCGIYFITSGTPRPGLEEGAYAVGDLHRTPAEQWVGIVGLALLWGWPLLLVAAMLVGYLVSLVFCRRRP
jgi:hypothetical protein